MKTSRFIFIVLGALVFGSGIATLLLFSSGAGTQIVVPQQGCTISTTDSDGDCVSNALDFYPYDALR